MEDELRELKNKDAQEQANLKRLQSMTKEELDELQHLAQQRVRAKRTARRTLMFILVFLACLYVASLIQSIVFLPFR